VSKLKAPEKREERSSVACALVECALE
jgi:hypothetical protein